MSKSKIPKFILALSAFRTQVITSGVDRPLPRFSRATQTDFEPRKYIIMPRVWVCPCYKIVLLNHIVPQLLLRFSVGPEGLLPSNALWVSNVSPLWNYIAVAVAFPHRECVLTAECHRHVDCGEHDCMAAPSVDSHLVHEITIHCWAIDWRKAQIWTNLKEEDAQAKDVTLESWTNI